MIAIVALFLPALSFMAPGIQARWSIAGMTEALGQAARPASGPAPHGEQPTLPQVMRQMLRIRAQFEQLSGRRQASIPWSYRLAAAIPAVLFAAGICAILALVAVAARWRRVLQAAAVIGACAAVYVLSAAAILARVIGREIASGAEQAQKALPLLGALHLGGRLRAEIHVSAQPGLYILLATFLALLLLPLPARRRAAWWAGR